MPNAPRYRLLAILAATLGLAHAAAAQGPPTLVFSTAANPDPVMIPATMVGSVTFTVTLSMASTAPIVKGAVDFSTLGNTAIQFTGGDINDKIGGGRLVAGGSCFSFANGLPTAMNIFNKGQSCTFIERFPTTHPIPDNDPRPGNWALNEVVSMVGYDANLNRVAAAANKVSFNAVVYDTPEPNSVALMASGLAALGLVWTARRRLG